MPERTFAGFDVGAHIVHGVLVKGSGWLVDARVFERRELAVAADWAAGATVVAIDAPSGLSTAPHADQEDLAPKFRGARCAEIALGRDWGIWVPWVTPLTSPADWMAHGFDLYAALRGRTRTVEVYPFAGFRVLGRPRLPPKLTVPGVRRRVEILARAGFAPDGLQAWSHDGIDAAMAAIIARDVGFGTAFHVTCGHDASLIALPAGALHGTPLAEGERPLAED